MKKKRNIRSEIQKLLRPDKAKKINEEQTKSAAEEQAELEKKVILAEDERLEPKNEVQSELPKNEYAEHEADEETEVQLEKQTEHEADEETEVQLEKQAEHEADEEAEVQLEKQAEHEADEETEVKLEEQTEHEAEEKTEAKPEKQAEHEADEEPEVQLEEQTEPEAEEKTQAHPGKQVEPENEEKTQAQPELHIKNNIKLGIKNIMPSSAQYTKYERYIQIKSEMNTSIMLKNQSYFNFTNMIMGKYGFERLNSTFSKLIFRQFQMILREDRPEANTESDRIIKNYTNFFNINKSVFNIIAQSIVSTNTKSYKEVRVPFYILKNSQLNSGNASSNGVEYEKEALKLLPKSSSKGDQISRNSKEEKSINSLEKNVGTVSNFYNLHYTQKTQEKLIETQKGEILNNTVDRITRIISQPISLLLEAQAVEKRIETLATKIQMNSATNISSDKANKPATKLLYDSKQPSKLRALIPESSRSISFEERSLSDRTSIGSNIEIINLSKIGSINRNTNKDINRSENRVDIFTICEKDNGSSDRAENAGNNTLTNYYKNEVTNLAINRPINETTNLAINRPINKIINLAINRTNNQTTNGSSNKNIRNNIVTNRIGNGVLNTTINKNSNGVLNTTINNNSNGFINKTVNIITNKVTNRLENTEETNRYPQVALMKNSFANNEMQELKPTELESTEKVEEGNQKSASEDIKQSEIILHTTLTKKDYTPKTKELLKSALVETDGAISRIIKSISNKQNAEGEEKTAYKKSNYQNRTSLIPAEIKQATKLKGTSNFTGKQLEDSSLIFCKPPVKETPIATEETHKNINRNDEHVFAKSVTSSKPQRKYNQIEVEEVNLIAERVFKMIEKRIAIQKDRRGLR